MPQSAHEKLSVSVLVPSYNHAQYIEACLESIAAQRGVDLQIVIVDDGSTDESPQIIQDWCDRHRERIDVTFLRQRNRGVARTLNAALAEARGDFVALLGSDDLLTDGSLLLRATQLNRHPKMEAAFGDAAVIDGQGRVLFASAIFDYHRTPRNVFCEGSSLVKGIIRYWSVPGPVLLARRSFIESIGAFDETRVVEDWDLYLRMVSTGKLMFIPDVVALYRVHDKNSARGQGREISVARELIASGLKRRSLFKFTDRLELYRRIIVIAYLLVTSIAKNALGKVRSN